MTWIQVVIGAIQLLRELLKFLKEKNECKAQVPGQLKDLRKGIKKARTKGDTDEIERVFRTALNGSNRSRMQDAK